MALGKKTGGRDIQKGQVLNPKGRPRLPEYLKKARKMNKALFQEILQKYMSCNITQLKKHLDDSQRAESKITALEVVVIKVLYEAMKKGDEKKLDFLLTRLIGKVKDEVEVSGNGGEKKIVVNFTRSGKEEED